MDVEDAPASAAGADQDGQQNQPEPPATAPSVAVAATAAAEKSGTAKRTPGDFLKHVLGRPVEVKLNSGVAYKGVLACLDGYMNIAMEQTEEYIDGQLKAKYGDCFIRGNNVMYISTARR